MAVTRMNLTQIQASRPKVNRAKVETTTEADIRRQAQEDGEDPDAPLETVRLVVQAAAVRQALGMSQPTFADLIGIPVGTLRNWEQDRVTPDPAARALLLILAREPEAALRALRATTAA